LHECSLRRKDRINPSEVSRSSNQEPLRRCTCPLSLWAGSELTPKNTNQSDQPIVKTEDKIAKRYGCTISSLLLVTLGKSRHARDREYSTKQGLPYRPHEKVFCGTVLSWEFPTCNCVLQKPQQMVDRTPATYAAAHSKQLHQMAKIRVVSGRGPESHRRGLVDLHPLLKVVY
jgi:hypothetical protein